MHRTIRRHVAPLLALAAVWVAGRTVPWNVREIGADEVWTELGISGEGSVIAYGFNFRDMRAEVAASVSGSSHGTWFLVRATSGRPSRCQSSCASRRASRRWSPLAAWIGT